MRGKGEIKRVKMPKKILLEVMPLLLLTVILSPTTLVSASPAATTIYVSPASIVGPPPNLGETFTVNINVNNVTDLYAWGVGLSWNASILNCTSFTYNYSFFGPQANVIAMAGAINNTAGTMDPLYAASLTVVSSGVTGSGTLARVTFLVKDYGTSWINLTVQSLLDSLGTPISYDALSSSFKLEVHGPTAVKTHTPADPEVYGTTMFNASGSQPGFNGTHDIPIANYTWSFGDGNTTTVTTPTIYHEYRVAATYLVRLTVKCRNDPVLIARGITSNTIQQNVTVIMPPHPVTIRVPRDFSTIQAAINAARDKDTVWVASGTYYENVIVNKSVTLMGENNSATIIDGKGKSYVVTITKNNVTVTGFTIRKGMTLPNWGYHGIYMQNVSGCLIRYNRITNNFIGIQLYGCDANTVQDNWIKDNKGGIQVDYSDGNAIVANIVESNALYGVYLLGSNGNRIHHNNFNNVYQAYDDTANAWDNGSQGNHWSDYAGQDLDHNGIGDTPYVIDSNSRDNYPLMNVWGHDVAVINITTSRTIGFFGYPVYIHVVLKNLGNYTETTNLSVYYESSLVGNLIVHLSAGAEATYELTWIPTGITKGDYTITAKIETVIGEFNTANNFYGDGDVRITIPGDANGDYYVGVMDLYRLGRTWLSGTDLRADFNCDGNVDVNDLYLLAKNWLKHA